PTRERNQHNRAGRHTRGDQVGHAIGDDPGLARARSGQDQVVAIGCHHGGVLRFVEVALELLGQPGAQRRFQTNLPHAGTRKGSASPSWTFLVWGKTLLYQEGPVTADCDPFLIPHPSGKSRPWPRKPRNRPRKLSVTAITRRISRCRRFAATPARSRK